MGTMVKNPKKKVFFSLLSYPQVPILLFPGVFPPSVAPKPHIGMLADSIFQKADIVAGKSAFGQRFRIVGAYFEMGAIVAAFYFI